MKKMLYLSLPIFISKDINDFNVVVDKTLASSLISGSISALNYANKLINLILGVFISAITTVIFNIVLNLILVQFVGHSGLALVTSIAIIIATILMFYT